MSHSFIQNCCWITLKVSYHQGRRLVSKMEGKTNFSGDAYIHAVMNRDCWEQSQNINYPYSLTVSVEIIAVNHWNSFMVWPDWPRPPCFTTDLRHWSCEWQFVGVCSSSLPCQHGGYVDPKNCAQCRCPDGFTGTTCQLLASQTDGNMPSVLLSMLSLCGNPERCTVIA